MASRTHGAFTLLRNLCRGPWACPAGTAGIAGKVAPVALALLIDCGLGRMVFRHNAAVTYMLVVACAVIASPVSAQPITEWHIEESGKSIDAASDSNHTPLSKEKLAQASLENGKNKYGSSDKKQDALAKRLSYCMAPRLSLVNIRLSTAESLRRDWCSIVQMSQ